MNIYKSFIKYNTLFLFHLRRFSDESGLGQGDSSTPPSDTGVNIGITGGSTKTVPPLTSSSTKVDTSSTHNTTPPSDSELPPPSQPTKNIDLVAGFTSTKFIDKPTFRRADVKHIESETLDSFGTGLTSYNKYYVKHFTVYMTYCTDVFDRNYLTSLAIKTIKNLLWFRGLNRLGVENYNIEGFKSITYILNSIRLSYTKFTKREGNFAKFKAIRSMLIPHIRTKSQIDMFDMQMFYCLLNGLYLNVMMNLFRNSYNYGKFEIFKNDNSDMIYINQGKEGHCVTNTFPISPQSNLCSKSTVMKLLGLTNTLLVKLSAHMNLLITSFSYSGIKTVTSEMSAVVPTALDKQNTKYIVSRVIKLEQSSTTAAFGRIDHLLLMLLVRCLNAFKNEAYGYIIVSNILRMVLSNYIELHAADISESVFRIEFDLSVTKARGHDLHDEYLPYSISHYNINLTHGANEFDVIKCISFLTEETMTVLKDYISILPDNYESDYLRTGMGSERWDVEVLPGEPDYTKSMLYGTLSRNNFNKLIYTRMLLRDYIPYLFIPIVIGRQWGENFNGVPTLRDEVVYQIESKRMTMIFDFIHLCFKEYFRNDNVYTYAGHKIDQNNYPPIFKHIIPDDTYDQRATPAHQQYRRTAPQVRDPLDQKPTFVKPRFSQEIKSYHTSTNRISRNSIYTFSKYWFRAGPGTDTISEWFDVTTHDYILPPLISDEPARKASSYNGNSDDMKSNVINSEYNQTSRALKAKHTDIRSLKAKKRVSDDNYSRPSIDKINKAIDQHGKSGVKTRSGYMSKDEVYDVYGKVSTNYIHHNDQMPKHIDAKHENIVKQSTENVMAHIEPLSNEHDKGVTKNANNLAVRMSQLVKYVKPVSTIGHSPHIKPEIDIVKPFYTLNDIYNITGVPATNRYALLKYITSGNHFKNLLTTVGIDKNIIMYMTGRLQHLMRSHKNIYRIIHTWDRNILRMLGQREFKYLTNLPDDIRITYLDLLNAIQQALPVDMMVKGYDMVREYKIMQGIATLITEVAAMKRDGSRSMTTAHKIVQKIEELTDQIKNEITTYHIRLTRIDLEGESFMRDHKVRIEWMLRHTKIYDGKYIVDGLNIFNLRNSLEVTKLIMRKNMFFDLEMMNTLNDCTDSYFKRYHKEVEEICLMIQQLVDDLANIEKRETEKRNKGGNVPSKGRCNDDYLDMYELSAPIRKLLYGSSNLNLNDEISRRQAFLKMIIRQTNPKAYNKNADQIDTIVNGIYVHPRMQEVNMAHGIPDKYAMIRFKGYGNKIYQMAKNANITLKLLAFTPATANQLTANQGIETLAASGALPGYILYRVLSEQETLTFFNMSTDIVLAQALKLENEQIKSDKLMVRTELVFYNTRKSDRFMNTKIYQGCIKQYSIGKLLYCMHTYINGTMSEWRGDDHILEYCRGTIFVSESESDIIRRISPQQILRLDLDKVVSKPSLLRDTGEITMCVIFTVRPAINSLTTCATDFMYSQGDSATKKPSKYAPLEAYGSALYIMVVFTTNNTRTKEFVLHTLAEAVMNIEKCKPLSDDEWITMNKEYMPTDYSVKRDLVRMNMINQATKAALRSEITYQHMELLDRKRAEYNIYARGTLSDTSVGGDMTVMKGMNNGEDNGTFCDDMYSQGKIRNCNTPINAVSMRDGNKIEFQHEYHQVKNRVHYQHIDHYGKDAVSLADSWDYDTQCKLRLTEAMLRKHNYKFRDLLDLRTHDFSKVQLNDDGDLLQYIITQEVGRCIGYVHNNATGAIKAKAQIDAMRDCVIGDSFIHNLMQYGVINKIRQNMKPDFGFEREVADKLVHMPLNSTAGVGGGITALQYMMNVDIEKLETEILACDRYWKDGSRLDQGGNTRLIFIRPIIVRFMDYLGLDYVYDYIKHHPGTSMNKDLATISKQLFANMDRRQGRVFAAIDFSTFDMHISNTQVFAAKELLFNMNVKHAEAHLDREQYSYPLRSSKTDGVILDRADRLMSGDYMTSIVAMLFQIERWTTFTRLYGDVANPLIMIGDDFVGELDYAQLETLKRYFDERNDPISGHKTLFHPKYALFNRRVFAQDVYPFNNPMTLFNAITRKERVPAHITQKNGDERWYAIYTAYVALRVMINFFENHAEIRTILDEFMCQCAPDKNLEVLYGASQEYKKQPSYKSIDTNMMKVIKPHLTDGKFRYPLLRDFIKMDPKTMLNKYYHHPYYDQAPLRGHVLQEPRYYVNTSIAYNKGMLSFSNIPYHLQESVYAQAMVEDAPGTSLFYDVLAKLQLPVRDLGIYSYANTTELIACVTQYMCQMFPNTENLVYNRDVLRRI